MRRHPEADQLEQPPRAVAVGVLVEHALARAAAQLLGLARVVEQVAVGGDRLVGVVDDEQLAARLEPALDPVVRVRDDRRARRRRARTAGTTTTRRRSRASGA